MSYENWKIKKSEFNAEEYSTIAQRCNESGAYHIEEIGDEYCVVANPVPTIEEQNKIISNNRANLYAELVDPLHAEKQRKTILGKWTETDEENYIAEVKRLSAKIEEENPYIE